MRNLVVFYLFKFSKKNDHNKQHQQRVKFFLQWNCQIPGKVAWNRITAQDLCHNWKLSFNNGVFKFSVFLSSTGSYAQPQYKSSMPPVWLLSLNCRFFLGHGFSCFGIRKHDVRLTLHHSKLAMLTTWKSIPCMWMLWAVGDKLFKTLYMRKIFAHWALQQREG